MDGLSVATRQLAGYMAGLVTVSAAISKMDTYTGLQNRLKLVTNSQVELSKATEDTFRIAQKHIRLGILFCRFISALVIMQKH